MTIPSRILVTGAAGIVGSALRPHLAARYPKVLLTDLIEIDNLAENEEFRRGDVTDPDFVRSLTLGVDGIVHLAGTVGPDYSFEEVLLPNIVATQNIFAAARDTPVDRVVYAGSHHTVGFLRCGSRIDEKTAPRPDSHYAVSKAYGEAAGAYYADKFGLHVLVIRIGYVGNVVDSRRRLRTWISARDLAQLVDIGLATRDLGYQIVYGVSDNPDPFFDNSNAVRLGYRPRDRSADVAVADFAESIPSSHSSSDAIADGVVGGRFASIGFAGDPNRVLGAGPDQSNRSRESESKGSPDP